MVASESREMYLKTILTLHLREQSSRSVDVANELGYTKASVSRAVGLLKEEGMITVEQGGQLVLTAEGRKEALKVYDRYIILRDYLLYLGVDPENAHEDACRMEHVISDATFEKLKKHVIKDHQIYKE
ncbi:MAG: metal-dependent transcriptional regulator [Tissierellia bacterium]|nr:metal-dependent transcriptional regulator [Tissierellia bacterium]